MKRLFYFLPIFMYANICAMALPKSAQRRIAVLTGHMMPANDKQDAPMVQLAAAGGFTAAYAQHVAAERVNEKLSQDHRVKDFDMSRYIPLINAVQAVEEQHPNHYSFVHAHSKSLKPIHDVYRELMRLKGTPLRDDWVPLRIEKDLCDERVDKYLTTHDMKKNHNYEGDNQKNLLSVNFSIPGNLYGPESSLRYFASDHSVEIPKTVYKEYFSNVISDAAEFLQVYLELKCEQLEKLLNSKEGVLVQLLIPKKDIDMYAYLARAAGYVLSDKIQLKDGTVLPGYDASHGFYTRISPYLEVYENDIHQLDNEIDRGQARIILHKDLLNRNDVIMKTHMYVAPEQLKKYYEAVRIYARILANKDVSFMEQDFLQVLKQSIQDGNLTPELINSMKGLVEKGHYYQQSLEIAQHGIKDADCALRIHSFKLMQALIEQGHYYQELLTTAQQGIKDTHEDVRHNSVKLMQKFVEKGRYYQEALAIAQQGIKDTFFNVGYYSRLVMEALIEKGQCYQEVLAIAQQGIKDTNLVVRSPFVELMQKFVEKGHYYQEALAMAQQSIRDTDVDVRNHSVELMQALVKKGHYYQEALAIAQQGLKDADVNVYKSAIDLRQLIEDRQRAQGA